MHRSVLPRLAALVALAGIGGALVACDGGTPGTDSGTPPLDVDPTVDAPRPDVGTLPSDAGAVESYSLTFGPVTVAPGQENTQCMVLRLGNPAALHVASIHNVLSEGSHHFIVYRTNDTTEQRTPFDCQPFVDTLNPAAGSPLMITQVADETLTLPSGVAFSLEANQMIRLEMHYVNPGAAPIEVRATSTFTSLPDSLFRDEADFLFIGSPDIDIPARSAATVGPVYFPLPTEFEGVNFFALTGHTHQLGTDMQVFTTPAETGADTAVYQIDGWSWSEPETARFDPPFVVPSGGGFRFQCDYQNTSASNVGFGESATDEMCFFWAYYYPSQGARVCFHTEQAGGVDLCCPGSSLCSLISSML
jgi:hypothetical protein